MARRLAAEDADFEAFEVVAWTHIADCIVQEAATATLVSTEATHRAWIAHESSQTLAALCSAWAVGMVRTSHRIVEQQNAAASAAATEALAWRAVSRAAQQDQSTASSPPPTRGEDPQRQYESSEARRRVSELNSQKLSMESDLNNLEATSQALKHSIESARRELSDLRTQTSETEAQIQARRKTALVEQQAAERELSELRQQVTRERSMLNSLRAETAAAELGSKQVSTVVSADRSVRAGTDAPMSPLAGTTTSSSNFSPRGVLSPGQQPTLASGLAALQSVREQLREIRESSASPVRRYGGAQQSPPGSEPSSAYGSLHYSQSAVMAAPHSPPSATSAGAASLHHSESATLAAPSPWKSRLLKLQDDLRTLRTELGTAPAA